MPGACDVMLMGAGDRQQHSQLAAVEKEINRNEVSHSQRLPLILFLSYIEGLYDIIENNKRGSLMP